MGELIVNMGMVTVLLFTLSLCKRVWEHGGS